MATPQELARPDFCHGHSPAKKSSSSSSKQFVDVGKEMAIAGTLAGEGIFDLVPADKLIPVEAFTDQLCRLVYGAARAVLAHGRQTSCCLSSESSVGCCSSTCAVIEASSSMSLAVLGSDSLIALTPAPLANFVFELRMKFATSVARVATSGSAMILSGRAASWALTFSEAAAAVCSALLQGKVVRKSRFTAKAMTETQRETSGRTDIDPAGQNLPPMHQFKPNEIHLVEAIVLVPSAARRPGLPRSWGQASPARSACK
jgi:hypothetical protein